MKTPLYNPLIRACRAARDCIIFVFVAAGFCRALPVSAQPGSNLFWQAQSIYQIITDRFYDGDTNNDNAEGTYAPGNPTGVHGGDFEGIEQKLDYIKALGATAIWISPIVLNTEGQFHGYSAWNFYEVAPHWGTLSNLQAMVQAAHARGLLVIDDIVVNHAGDLVTGSGSGYPTFNYPTGYTLSYVNGSKTYPAPFNLSTTNPSLTNLFHNYGNIDSFSDTNQVILGWLDGLNDFRTETSYVRSNMAAIYQYWIAQAGFDAFRVDKVWKWTWAAGKASARRFIPTRRPMATPTFSCSPRLITVTTAQWVLTPDRRTAGRLNLIQWWIIRFIT